MKRAPSLKSKNMKWLIGLAALDVVALLCVSGTEFAAALSMRTASASMLPVIVIILVGMLPSTWKETLVYWRLKDVLPGCRAFSIHAPSDGRIDMAALKKNVGAFPETAAEQNSKWFKLYKLVENETAVTESHKLFLMYRDMAAMSLLLSVLAPIALLALNFPPLIALSGLLLFTVQYLATAVPARHSGERMVCNVLAVHSTRKITAPK